MKKNHLIAATYAITFLSFVFSFFCLCVETATEVTGRESNVRGMAIWFVCSVVAYIGAMVWSDNN